MFGAYLLWNISIRPTTSFCWQLAYTVFSCISVEIDVKGKLKVGKVAILSLIWVPETIDFLTKLRFQTALTRVS